MLKLNTKLLLTIVLRKTIMNERIELDRTRMELVNVRGRDYVMRPNNGLCRNMPAPYSS